MNTPRFRIWDNHNRKMWYMDSLTEGGNVVNLTFFSDGSWGLYENVTEKLIAANTDEGNVLIMLKDQSKGGGLVFLKPHPKYPEIKDISMMTGREPKPLFECNGFCGTNDLTLKNETETELNRTLK